MRLYGLRPRTLMTLTTSDPIANMYEMVKGNQMYGQEAQ